MNTTMDWNDTKIVQWLSAPYNEDLPKNKKKVKTKNKNKKGRKNNIKYVKHFIEKTMFSFFS